MIGRTLMLGTMAGMLLALAMVVPGAARAQDGVAAGKAPPAGDASGKCDYLLAKILPGDFNFCIASKYWSKGKHDRAAEMLKLAAGWGNKAAQTALGVAYFNGDGVAQDRALGLAWLALAAERQAPTASGLYVSARGKVDTAEYERAITLYQQMRTTYADDVAAVRADNRYRREVHALESNPAYGAGKCIDGFSQIPFANPGDPAQATGVERMQSCSLSSEYALLKAVEKRYEVYSAGWNGRVSVGSVEPVKPTAKP